MANHTTVVRPPGALAWHCTAGRDSLAAVTCDAKISIVDNEAVSVSWIMGSPVHRQGAWDRFVFD
jgi:hypothetical protein